MSDNEIKKILIERKRKEAEEKRRAAIIELLQDASAWGGLLVICFMMSVIGA